MVRETRHLWVGNLPENISEDRIRDHFKRYGPVQSVKFLSGGDEGVCAAIAFVDICSAAKAHKADHRLDERLLKTTYYEPSLTAVTATQYSSSGGHREYSSQSNSHPPHGPRSPRFSSGLSEEHNSYDRSSHFYESRRDENIGYNGPGVPPGVGPGLRRPYSGEAEFSTGSRGRVRAYPPSRGHFLTNGRAEPNEYRWSGVGQYRYHNENYPPEEAKIRRSQEGPVSPPPHVPPRVAAAVRGMSRMNSRRCVLASRSGSESPSSTSRSSSSSSSSSNSSRSSSSRSGGSPGGALSSRSTSRSPRRLRSTSQPLSLPILSSPNEKRALAISVKNLPVWSTDNSLKDGLFHDYKKHGKVTLVRIFGSKSDRYAVVCFKKFEDAHKALEASQDKQFFGVDIQVSPHEGLELDENEFRTYDVELDEYHPKATRTLFIGGLDKEVTATELRKHFEPFGEIIEIDIKKQNSSTYAFCQYSDIRSVVQAVKKMDGEHLCGNRIKLGFGKSMPNRCIWVGGVSDGLTETILVEHFNRFGAISHRNIDRDKGHALVAYENERHASTAVTEMRGVTLNSKKLQIDFASRECQVAFFENLNKQEFSSPSDRTTWERRDSEKYDRSRRDQYISRQVSSQRLQSYSSSSSRSRSRFESFEDYTAGRNYDDFADDSFERDLHEYAGRQRYENGPTTTSATASSTTSTTSVKHRSPPRKREDGSPHSPPTVMREFDNLSPLIRPYDDLDSHKSVHHRSTSDQDSFHSQSPPPPTNKLSPRGRVRMPSRSPSISSPSREVTMMEERSLSDPRRRKPSDLKDLVVRVSDHRRPSESHLRHRINHRIPSDHDDTEGFISRAELHDPRLLLRRDEQFSSGDERSVDGERPNKKCKYSSDMYEKCLKNPVDYSYRSHHHSNFRKPFESRKVCMDKYKKDRCDDPLRSPPTDPRLRRGSEADDRHKDITYPDEFQNDASPPGTPVRDEREDPEIIPPPPRRFSKEKVIMSLPLPKFAQHLRFHSSPRAVSNSPRPVPILKSLSFNPGICNFPLPPPDMTLVPEETDPILADTPVSPGPALHDPPSDCEESTTITTPAAAGDLNERIKALDEKFEKWTGNARSMGKNLTVSRQQNLLQGGLKNHSLRKRRIPELNELRSQEPSAFLKSVLSKHSIFDEDSKRLENVSDKYEPKAFSSVPKSKLINSFQATTCTFPTASIQGYDSNPIPSATPLNSLPGIRIKSINNSHSSVSSLGVRSPQSIISPTLPKVKIESTATETVQSSTTATFTTSSTTLCTGSRQFSSSTQLANNTLATPSLASRRLSTSVVMANNSPVTSPPTLMNNNTPVTSSPSSRLLSSSLITSSTSITSSPISQQQVSSSIPIANITSVTSSLLNRLQSSSTLLSNSTSVTLSPAIRQLCSSTLLANSTSVTSSPSRLISPSTLLSTSVNSPPIDRHHSSSIPTNCASVTSCTESRLLSSMQKSAVKTTDIISTTTKCDVKMTVSIAETLLLDSVSSFVKPTMSSSNINLNLHPLTPSNVKCSSPLTAQNPILISKTVGSVTDVSAAMNTKPVVLEKLVEVKKEAISPVHCHINALSEKEKDQNNMEFKREKIFKIKVKDQLNNNTPMKIELLIPKLEPNSDEEPEKKENYKRSLSTISDADVSQRRRSREGSKSGVEKIYEPEHKKIKIEPDDDKEKPKLPKEKSERKDKGKSSSYRKEEHLMEEKSLNHGNESLDSSSKRHELKDKIDSKRDRRKERFEEKEKPTFKSSIQHSEKHKLCEKKPNDRKEEETEKKEEREDKLKCDHSKRRHSEDSKSHSEKKEKRKEHKDKFRNKERHRETGKSDKDKSRNKDRSKHKSKSDDRIRHNLSKDRKERRENSLSSPSENLISLSDIYEHSSNKKSSKSKSTSVIQEDDIIKVSSSKSHRNKENELERTLKEMPRKKHDSGKNEKGNEELNKNKPSALAHSSSKSTYIKSKSSLVDEDENMESEDPSSDDEVKCKPGKRTSHRTTSSSSGSRRGLPSKNKSIFETESDTVDSESDSDQDQPKKASYFDITIYDGNMYDKVKARRLRAGQGKQEDDLTKPQDMKQKQRYIKLSKKHNSSSNSDDSDSANDMPKKRASTRIHSSSEDDSLLKVNNSAEESDSINSKSDRKKGNSLLDKIKKSSRILHVSDITTDDETMEKPQMISGSDSDSEPRRRRKEALPKMESDSDHSDTGIPKPPRPALSVGRGRVVEKDTKIGKFSDSLIPRNNLLEHNLPFPIVSEVRHTKTKLRLQSLDLNNKSGKVLENKERKEGRMKAIFGLMSDDSDSNTPTSTDLISATSYRKGSSSSGTSPTSTDLISATSYRKRSSSSGTSTDQANTDSRIHQSSGGIFESDEDIQPSISELPPKSRPESINIPGKVCEMKAIKDDIMAGTWRETAVKESVCDTTSRASDSGKGSSSGVSTASNSSGGSSAEELLLLESINASVFKEQQVEKKPFVYEVTRKDKKKKKKHKEKDSNRSHHHSSKESHERSHFIDETTSHPFKFSQEDKALPSPSRDKTKPSSKERRSSSSRSSKDSMTKEAISDSTGTITGLLTKDSSLPLNTIVINQTDEKIDFFKNKVDSLIKDDDKGLEFMKTKEDISAKVKEIEFYKTKVDSSVEEKGINFFRTKVDSSVKEKGIDYFKAEVDCSFKEKGKDVFNSEIGSSVIEEKEADFCKTKVDSSVEEKGIDFVKIKLDNSDKERAINIFKTLVDNSAKELDIELCKTKVDRSNKEKEIDLLKTKVENSVKKEGTDCFKPKLDSANKEDKIDFFKAIVDSSIEKNVMEQKHVENISLPPVIDDNKPIGDAPPPKPSRSTISQEETLNAVAGLLACYNDYQDDEEEQSSTTVEEEPEIQVEILPPTDDPNEQQSEEAQKAAQMLQSEMPEVEEGDRRWNSLPPRADSSTQLETSQTPDISSVQPQRQPVVISPKKQQIRQSKETHILFPDSPSSVQSEEPVLQIDEDDRTDTANLDYMDHRKNASTAISDMGVIRDDHILTKDTFIDKTLPEDIHNQSLTPKSMSPILTSYETKTEEINKLDDNIKKVEKTDEIKSSLEAEKLVELPESSCINKSINPPIKEEMIIKPEEKLNNESIELKHEETSVIKLNLDTNRAELQKLTKSPNAIKELGLEFTEVRHTSVTLNDSQSKEEITREELFEQQNQSFENESEKTDEEIKTTSRGRGRGRGRRGCYKTATDSLSPEAPMATRSSSTTRCTRGRGRGKHILEEDEKLPDQLRRSTRTKKARKHPDMVEHDETTNRRRRSIRGGKSGDEFGMRACLSGSDVYDFHESDDDVNLAVGKKVKKPATPTQSPSKGPDESLEGEVVSPRKSRRLQDKGDENDSSVVSDSDIVSEETLLISSARNKKKLKKDGFDEEIPSPRKSPRSRSKNNECEQESEKPPPSKLESLIPEVVLVSKTVETVSGSSMQPSIMVTPKTLIIPCHPSKDTMVPKSFPQPVNVSYSQQPLTSMKLSIVQSALRTAVAKVNTTTSATVPVIAVTSLPSGSLPREVLVTQTSLASNTAKLPLVSIPVKAVLPLGSQSVKAVLPLASLPHSAFKAFPNGRKTDLSTPLVDPVTGHLTPMKISDEGHYIPIAGENSSALLTLDGKDKLQHAKLLRVIPTSAIKNSSSSLSPSLVVSSRVATLTKGVSVATLHRGSEVSVELVSRTRPTTIPFTSASVQMTTTKGVSTYLQQKSQVPVTLTSHSVMISSHQTNTGNSMSSNITSVLAPGKIITSNVPRGTAMVGVSLTPVKVPPISKLQSSSITKIVSTTPAVILNPTSSSGPQRSNAEFSPLPSNSAIVVAQSSTTVTRVGPPQPASVVTLPKTLEVRQQQQSIPPHLSPKMDELTAQRLFVEDLRGQRQEFVTIPSHRFQDPRYRELPMVEVSRLSSPHSPAGRPSTMEACEPAHITTQQRQHYEIQQCSGNVTVPPNRGQGVRSLSHVGGKMSHFFPPSDLHVTSLPPGEYLASPPLRTPPSAHTPPPAHHHVAQQREALPLVYHHGQYIAPRPAVFGESLPIDLKTDKADDNGPPPPFVAAAPGMTVITPHAASSPHQLSSPHYDRSTDSPQVTMTHPVRYSHFDSNFRCGTPGGGIDHEDLPRSPLPYPPPLTPGEQRVQFANPNIAAAPIPPHTDNFQYLLQDYPVMWEGILGLKNDQAQVKMHFISGSLEVARGALHVSDDKSPQIKIAQRMRLEQMQLEGVSRKMQMEAEHCILMALPFGHSHYDNIQQRVILENGFIKYLGDKKAAGIHNIAAPGSHQSAYVIHIFPPCDFANESLIRIAPELLHGIGNASRLLVVIATC